MSFCPVTDEDARIAVRMGYREVWYAQEVEANRAQRMLYCHALCNGQRIVDMVRSSIEEIHKVPGAPERPWLIY